MCRFDEIVLHARFVGCDSKRVCCSTFNQVLHLDGLTLGQSGAHYRILARKTGLDGYGDDKNFALNQQLIEEYQVGGVGKGV
jgi:hypothetical protein